MLRTWTDDDGMLAGRFRFTPEVGAEFLAAVEARTRSIFRNRRKADPAEREPMECYAADALASLVAEAGDVTDTPVPDEPNLPGPKPPAKRRRAKPYTVHVFIDHAVLQRGSTLPGERCEIPGVGPVNAQWVRSILGDAFVTSIIHKGVDISTVTHHGRRISAVLQTALTVQGRECDIEGCGHRGYLERDHVIIDFAKNGPTALWNLTWLCYRHHQRKSAGGQLSAPDPGTGKRSFVSEEGSRAAA